MQPYTHLQKLEKLTKIQQAIDLANRFIDSHVKHADNMQAMFGENNSVKHYRNRVTILQQIIARLEKYYFRTLCTLTSDTYNYLQNQKA